MILERTAFAFALSSAAPLLAQESATIFDAPLCIANGRHHFETLLNLNGDAFPDAVALTLSSGSVGMTTFMNDGTGALVSTTGFTSAGSYNENTEAHVERCDFNHDGLDDFYLAVMPTTSEACHIWLLAATPAGSTSFISGMSYTGLFSDARLLDLDADGTLDRVRVFGAVLSVDHLVLNTTTNGYDATTLQLNLGFSPSVLVPMDCDGDGDLDIYAHANGQGVFVPMSGATPGTPIPVPHGIDSPMPMAIPGDIDGDGDVDLTIFDMTGYSVVRRTGPSTWVPEARRVGGPAAKFADVDLDGDLDGVCCGGGGGSTYYYFSVPSTFRVSLNDGTGNFAAAFTFPGSGSREIAGAADMDGDGDVDLLAGNCIYYSRGPLVGPPGAALANGEQSRQSLVDFDRDGDPDFTPGVGAFRRNLGDASSHDYDAQLPIAPSGSVFEGPGLQGDFDGDGDSDLIVRVRTAGIVTSMRLLANGGGGTFVDVGNTGLGDYLHASTIGTRPENAFVHDLDLDGDQDLVTFVRSAPGLLNGQTWVWRNDGSGHFTGAWTDTGGWPLGLGRLVGDAWPDLVIARNGQGVAYVLPGLGNGAFTYTGSLQLYLGTTIGPASLAIADFDLDGDDDVVGALQFGGTAWFTGSAYFIPNIGGSLSLNDKVLLDALDDELTSGALPTPRIALAGDLNGDGLLDAILSCPSHRRAAISIVLRSTDNSGWRTPVRQVVYYGAGGIQSDARVGVLADVDGDGDADYVTDRLWRNVTRVPPDGGARRQTSSGWPDANGLVPTLGAVGPFRVGHAAEIRLTGAPGGVSGVMIDSYAVPQLPFGSGPMHLATPVRIAAQIPLTTSGVAGVAACGEWHLPFTVPGYVAGRTKNYTVVIPDVWAPGGEIRSNVLTITYGP